MYSESELEAAVEAGALSPQGARRLLVAPLPANLRTRLPVIDRPVSSQPAS